jgi:hypothetical protein
MHQFQAAAGFIVDSDICPPLDDAAAALRFIDHRP